MSRRVGNHLLYSITTEGHIPPRSNLAQWWRQGLGGVGWQAQWNLLTVREMGLLKHMRREHIWNEGVPEGHCTVFWRASWGPSTHPGVTVGHRWFRDVTVSQLTNRSQGVRGVQGENHGSLELLGSLLTWCM